MKETNPSNKKYLESDEMDYIEQASEPGFIDNDLSLPQEYNDSISLLDEHTLIDDSIEIYDEALTNIEENYSTHLKNVFNNQKLDSQYITEDDAPSVDSIVDKLNQKTDEQTDEQTDDSNSVNTTSMGATNAVAFTNSIASVDADSGQNANNTTSVDSLSQNFSSSHNQDIKLPNDHNIANQANFNQNNTNMLNKKISTDENVFQDNSKVVNNIQQSAKQLNQDTNKAALTSTPITKTTGSEPDNSQQTPVNILDNGEILGQDSLDNSTRTQPAQLKNSDTDKLEDQEQYIQLKNSNSQKLDEQEYNNINDNNSLNENVESDGTTTTVTSKELSISTSDNSATENTTGDDGGQFTVSLSQAADTDTVISYTIGGNATNGTDYQDLSGEVIIQAGETTAIVNLSILDDNILKDSENVTVTLDSVVSGDTNITIGAQNSATVLISDDDAASTNIINGTNGNDTITATDGVDLISGHDGDDTLYANNGDDTMYGGAGNDILYGDDGEDDSDNGADADDVIFGQEGDDTIYASRGDDLVYGGSGNDTIYGGRNSDTLYGDDDNDYINGQSGGDTIYGGAGDDIIDGDKQNDNLYGGAGNDTMYGGDDDDVFHDVMAGDSAYGENDNDTFYYQDSATAETSVLVDGGSGTDTLNMDTNNTWSVVFSDSTTLHNINGALSGSSLPDLSVSGNSVDLAGKTAGNLVVDDEVISFTGVEYINWS